jgi:hypothetical protein
VNKPMQAILARALRQHYAKAPGDTVAERVVQRLIDKALAGDVTSIRFIFESIDVESVKLGADPAGRPLIEVLDPDD